MSSIDPDPRDRHSSEAAGTPDGDQWPDALDLSHPDTGQVSGFTTDRAFHEATLFDRFPGISDHDTNHLDMGELGVGDLGVGVDEFVTGPREHAAQLGAPAGGVIRWEDLTGQARAVAWHQLRLFVDWWCTRYRVNERLLPTCWYLHPALVEELTALMTARRASFSDDDQGYGPIGWQERAWQVRQRIETTWYKGECQSGHIQAPARAATSAETFEQFVEQDVQQRGTVPSAYRIHPDDATG